MSNLTTANQSPRYEDNKFIWYEGDTFVIEFTIDLYKIEDNEAITSTEGDEIIVNFFKNEISVHKFVYPNFVNGDTISLNFDEKVTKKFKAGTYNYIITFKGDSRTTIVANNKVEVEK